METVCYIEAECHSDLAHPFLLCEVGVDYFPQENSLNNS